MIDLAVIAAYLVGTVLLGSWLGRDQSTVREYFVGRQRVPWWAVAGSIVATETSTVTFISVPGYAFARDFTFLQLVFGYLAGRIVVCILFVPAYFRGELLTVYELLGSRFGGRTKQLASSLFLTTRSLSDGFRLFATGLVLAALVGQMPALGRAVSLGSSEPGTILIGSVLIMGVATVVYTYLGGMTAVIWTDVVQLIVYLVGALVAAAVLLDRIPGGLGHVIEAAQAAGKLRVIDLSWGLSRSYTFWAGLIGGAFLTMSTHGTDQLMVQRYLCSASVRDARLAILSGAALVFVQFVLFLLIGTMLAVYYAHAPGELAVITANGQVQTDRVFPQFIVTHLPAGLAGLVIAAVFAAAMSTLSSSLNSCAAAVVGDFYLPFTRRSRSDAHYLRVARALTLAWGAVQVAVALLAIRLSTRVVDEVLGIAAFTNGVILGLFFLGALRWRIPEAAAFAGVICGLTMMAWLRIFTTVSWQWYVLAGSMVTMASGVLAARVLVTRTPEA